LAYFRKFASPAISPTPFPFLYPFFLLCCIANTDTKQWVITNVSTGFYDIDIEPAFFRWGYAWPLHNVVEASRQILFGLHSRIGLNFGVLFAWAAVNTALVSFASLSLLVMWGVFGEWCFVEIDLLTFVVFLVPAYLLVLDV
jgi:hypothetical protein